MAIPNDCKEVATQSIRDRLDDGQCSRRGDRGIDGVAALEEHAYAGLRRERLGGRDNISSHQRRTDRRIGVVPVKIHEETVLF